MRLFSITSLIILASIAGIGTYTFSEFNASVKSVTTKMDKTATANFYALQAKDIDGNMVDFSDFKGKPVVIVNTASQCGFTSQYEELQAMHEQYGKDIHILGFPCNQFGYQEPGSEEEIKTFCEKNFGVSFKMFSKVDVKGDNQHPVYQWLTDPEKNGWNKKEPNWNFCKYVIDADGKLVEFFPSTVKPDSDKMKKALGV